MEVLGIPASDDLDDDPLVSRMIEVSHRFKKAELFI
jgi:hypothetical protein